MLSDRVLISSYIARFSIIVHKILKGLNAHYSRLNVRKVDNAYHCQWWHFHMLHSSWIFPRNKISPDQNISEHSKDFSGKNRLFLAPKLESNYLTLHAIIKH